MSAAGAQIIAPSEVATPRRRALTASGVVYFSGAVYALIFSVAAVLYYLGFHDPRLDLGDMVQAIWSASHGHLFTFTTPTGQELSRLGAHVDVFLIVFVPLWWIWPSPVALLVLQAIAVTAGALPVFWLARKHLGSPAAGAQIAFAYLLFPATQFNAFTPSSGFHSISFGVPLILLAIWFLDNDRFLPFGICALAAASTKEEVGAAVGCLGLWYAARTGRRGVGFLIFALGVALTAVELTVLVPHFSAPGYSPFAERYARAGGSTTAIVTNMFVHPIRLLEITLNVHKVVYLLLLLCPLLGLSLLEPLLLIGAVPDLAINLLSDKGTSTILASSYTAGILPFVFASAIFGMSKLRYRAKQISFATLCGVFSIALYSPILITAHMLTGPLSNSAIRSARAHAISLVPAGAAVSTTNQLGGYVSARRSVEIFPSVSSASWLLLDTNDNITVADLPAFAEGWMKRHPAWEVVYASAGVYVLRHTVSLGGRR